MRLKPMLAETIHRPPAHRIRRRVLMLMGINYPGLNDGIARYAREVGWILNNTYAKAGLPPVWWRGDGIIALIANPKDCAALRRFPRLPTVDVSRGWISNAMPPRLRRQGAGVPRVLYDNAAIGRLAAEHLLERGFKDVAFFNYGNYWMETERIPSFRAALAQAGARWHEIPYYRHASAGSRRAARDERAAIRWLVRVLERLPKPLAIFTASDEFSLLVLSACDGAGLAVPEEIAVLGCDNEEFVCAYAPIPLSSIDVNLDGLGYEAARLLDRLIDGKSPPAQPIIVPVKGLVVRQSTNILAVPHPKVARALRFIWEHFQEPIQARDVVRIAGLSRRALEEAFRKHLGRTLAGEILQCRVAHARKLLLETDLKAHQIANQSGFSGIVHFSEAFKRLAGQRPSHFRRRQRRARAPLKVGDCAGQALGSP
jgi:LacI family transcriptional regulator